LIKFTKKAVSFTRNKARWACVILVMLVVLCIVVFWSSIFASKKTVSCLGQGSQPTGKLNGGAPLIQTFTPEQMHIDYIEIRMATNLESGNVLAPQGYLHFKLTRIDGKVLYEEKVPIRSIKDNEYLRFRVRKDLDIQKEYMIVLETVDTIGEEVPSVWISSNVPDELNDVIFPGLPTDAHMQCNTQIRYSHMNYPAMIISILLVFLCGLIAVLHFDLSEKNREHLTISVMYFMPILMFTIVELLNGNSVLKKSMPAFIVNYIYYLVIYVVLLVIFNRFRLTTIIVNSILFGVAIFNYFKLLWRGEPVQLWDVVTLKTAMNVSDNYHIELSPILIIATLLFVLSILLISKCRYAIVMKRNRAYIGGVCVILIIFLALTLIDTRRYQNANFSLMEKMGVVNNTGNPAQNFSKNGMIVALTMNAQHLAVEKPGNYSVDQVQRVEEKIENQYAHYILPNEVILQHENGKKIREACGERQLKEGEKPTIICIMNESYSDMSTVGSFETNLPMHPYMDSLYQKQNVIHGDLCVSVYGGGTANSEFEFLTGNPMAFFPTGSIPYQQYIGSTTGSLPRFLKSQGYQTVAVHPYLASGWNRPSVYTSMAFDRFVSIDDFTEECEYIRSYISDRSSYKKLIELYEDRDPKHPLFLFNVTMQNHGSYTSTDPNFNQDVRLVDYPDKFPETEQYLTLARQSDMALEDLIGYFSNVDDPVIICFFGDHLPSMINGFYETLLGKEIVDLTGEEMQDLYKTDFFIWANYDIPEYEVPQISLNYLSTLLLQQTGMDLPAYNLLIADAYDHYPVLTSMGVYDKLGNRYDTVMDVPDASGVLNEYNILTYNNLFESKKRRSELYDVVYFVPQKKETEIEE